LLLGEKFLFEEIFRVVVKKLEAVPDFVHFNFKMVPQVLGEPPLTLKKNN
jgi:hypothetical protein